MTIRIGKYSMSFIIILALGIGFSHSPTNAKEQIEIYSKVKILFQSQDEVKELAIMGLIFDHAKYEETAKGASYLTAYVNSRELRILKKSRFPFEILVKDVVAEYHSRPKLSKEDKLLIEAKSMVLGFGLGSMGGHYTFDEVVTELDSMASQYPNIISAKQSFGTSHENRDLWIVKISDNPNLDEDEPEVLYTALHHACEPQSMTTVMCFMNYLLENYGTDPEVTYLVDNRELYFVPVVNPDGYVFNEIENPTGGGLWRKNRRNNGDEIYGVDLNRNYGYKWEDHVFGSDPIEDIYRGPYAFSEPETQAIRDLCINHNFILALNYHSPIKTILYPWGYDGSDVQDIEKYMNYASEMTQQNLYNFGQAFYFGWLLNGISDDWMHGEQETKNKIFAMTPEVAPGDPNKFWPTGQQIITIAEENIHPNLYAAWVSCGLPDTVDLVLQNETITTSEVYTAAKSITAGSDFVIADDAEVNFICENKIYLEYGFCAEAGSEFQAYIDKSCE